MCQKEIGLSAQTILKLQNQHNLGGRGYLTIYEHINLHFDNAYDIHMNSKNCEESGYGFGNHLVLIACFIR